MKFFWALAFFVCSSTGFSSSFETVCSDANQFIQHIQKNGIHRVVLKERQNGEVISAEYGLIDLNVTWGDKTEVFREVKNGCKDDPDAHVGVVSVKEIYATTVSVSKVDGTSFSEQTIGLGMDEKTMEQIVICEHYRGSEVPCASL